MKPFLHRYGAHCCAEQVDITEGCPKIDLFAFKGHDRVLHIGWSYGVGPKVNMRLFWIAYVCTLSDFLYLRSWRITLVVHCTLLLPFNLVTSTIELLLCAWMCSDLLRPHLLNTPIKVRPFSLVAKIEKKKAIYFEMSHGRKKARMQEMATNKKWGKTFSILVRCTYLPLFAILSL